MVINYEYKCVYVPQAIRVGKNSPKEAIQVIENLMNKEAADGWQFDKIDNIISIRSKGCLASLMGQGTEQTTLKMLIFRRPLR